MKSVVLINVFWLLLLKLVVLDGVEVKQNIPDDMRPGEEYTVSFTVKKENIQGFAKIQQTLPDGFTAVDPVETKGATFSFKDQKVKFIWMALPSESEFTVSYKVKLAETVSGKYNLEGRFAYIENNERKNFDIPTVSVNIESEEVASNDDGGNETTKKDEEEEPIQEPTVTVKRSIKPLEDNSFEVKLEINKGSISGFAKVEDIVPNGFVAQELSAGTGMFSFKEQKAKVLWMALPAKETFTVNYKLVPNDSPEEGTNTISGSFNYVFNEETREIDIPSTAFNYTSPQQTMLVDNTEEPEDETTEQPETEDRDSEEPESKEKITSTPEPEKEVSYKVQVCASHRTVSGNYFSNKYGLQDKVSTEYHEGWTKYVVGKYNVYKAARDKRNNIWNGNQINDAFVTAYNSGKRITVQEALMISNQQWYK